MTVATWGLPSWLMVLSMLIASAACIVSAFKWRLRASALMLAIPPAAALIEHWWPMPQGGGTIFATTAYVAMLVIDYQLTHYRSQR